MGCGRGVVTPSIVARLQPGSADGNQPTRAPVVVEGREPGDAHPAAGVRGVQDATAADVDGDVVDAVATARPEEHQVARPQVLAAYDGTHAGLVRGVARQLDADLLRGEVGEPG